MSAHAIRPGAAAPAPSVRRIGKVVGTACLCLAALLRTIDAIPSWIRDEPRGLRKYETIEALERDTRTQLVLPFYFPDTLAWPPAAVLRSAGEGRPTSVTIVDRATGDPRLLIFQCLDHPCVVPFRLLPEAHEVRRTMVDIAGTRASMVQRAGTGRDSILDLDWEQFGRHLSIRMFGGDEATLLRIARSMRRGHP